MRDTLRPGLEHAFTFRADASKCVPALYPEAEEFQAMPNVFATGYMVGLIEWTCIQAVNPHLDWPAEQTVGTRVDVSHVAATPPGMDITAKVRLVEVDGRRLVFDVEAYDELDLISRGRHERFIIHKPKFDLKLQEKSRNQPGRHRP
jgi:fluoroacetyl-CoA thioesterase